MTDELSHLGDPAVIDVARDTDQPLSIQERLARVHRDMSDHRWVDLDVPGYGGDLFGRYKMIDGHTVASIVTKSRKQIKDQVERGVAAASDVLIAALEEFWVRDDGREIRLAEVVGQDEPVRFDIELAKFLRFDGELDDHPTARKVLLKLFVDNGIAVGAHSQTFQKWLTENGVKVDEEFLGE